MRPRGFRRLRVGGVVLTIISAALATVAAPAHADTNVGLAGLTKFAHMKVDDSHVFLTGGSGSTSILVTNYAGATVANITNEAGADGMALSPDRTTLYVALSGADAISVINTATLTETARYATGASTCPHAVALAGSKLWFGYGCADGSSQIGWVDPSTNPATVSLAQSSTSWYYPPLFATSPGNPNLLVAGEPGQSPSSATIYDVSTGSLVTVASNGNLGGNLGDIEVSPDATKLYVSDGGVYYEQVYSTSDFSNVTSYSTGGPYPTAVALSADGRVLATGRNGSPDVYLYQVGGSSAYRTLTFADANNGYPYSVAHAGMAFSPDGSELFVLSTPIVGSPPVLHIIAAPEKTPSSISLSAPATAKRGGALTIHGTVSEFGGAITSPQILAVTKQDLSGTHSLPTVTTSASGSFSFGDTPPVGGPDTYTVSWAGDAGHLAATSHATVNVSRHATSISVATKASTINYQQAVTVTVHLGATYNRRFVTIYAQPKGLAKKAIKAGNVNSHGIMKVVAHPGRDTTFSAVFNGDYRFATASSAGHVRTRAAVVAKMLGWYANSQGSRVYHHAVNPTVSARLSPGNKAGENLCFPLQVYTGGVWRTLVRKCFPMDAGGSASVFLYGSNTPGMSYRLRVEFAGDSTNAAANSVWYSFRFTT
jgi:YVTN family beta-propeller protein